MPQIRQKNYPVELLANRVRVVTAPFKDRLSVSIGIWVHTGARDETHALGGVSHFLEHLVFKGTRRRTANQIKEAVEGVGGTLNAFTSEECTCFLAKTSRTHLPQVFDVLSDMVLGASLKKEDIDKERAVVMEEIKMTQDHPSELAEELFAELLWPAHALGRPIAGTLKTVAALTPEEIRSYRDTYYKPDFITIVASGGLTHQTLTALAKKHFGSQAPANRQKKTDMFRSQQKKPQVKLLSKPTKQTQVVLGMHACEKNHPDEYGLDILSVLLGGNMSSRLFNKVREERGLAYDIGTGVRKFHETGSFSVSAGVDPAKAAEALRVILDELDKITRKPVTEGELKRAKEFYLGQFDLSLENTMNHMLWVGDSVVSNGRAKTHEEVTLGVKKVTRKDVRRIAANIFKDQALNLAMVGPKANRSEAKLTKLLSF